MKLTVVGCSGSFPGAASASSCYLIEHDGTRLLLDMGSGSLGALAKYVDIYSIDAVALSHLHPDHCADLTGFHVARKYVEDGPKPSIPVFGPRGTEQRMVEMLGHDSDSLTKIFDFVEYDDSAITIGSLSLSAHEVVHCIPAFALRVAAGGSSLIYSGDTAACPQLAQAAGLADVALFEASYLSRRENPPGIHMTGTDCADIANEAGVSRLILTHLVPWNDPAEVLAEATQTYHDDVKLAYPGLEEEI